MKGSNLRLIVGKIGCLDIESLWYVVVRLFVHRYRHFEVFVSLHGKLDFVYDLVLILQFLRVLNFKNFVVLVIIGDYDLDLVIVVRRVKCLCGVVICNMCFLWLIYVFVFLFVHQKVLCLLMWTIFQKILQKVCGLRFLVYLIACVMDKCYKFFLIERR